MRAALRQIADVTDVVAFAVLINVFENLLFAAHRCSHLEGLQDADAVIPPPAQIIGFTDPWRLPEFLDESGDILGMDVVADLLPLVAEDPVEVPLDIAADQVAQESM